MSAETSSHLPAAAAPRSTPPGPRGGALARSVTSSRAFAEALRAAEARKPPGRWARRLAACVVLLGLGASCLLGASYVARSEVATGPTIDALIERVNASSELHVTRGDVRPVGWAGLEIRDLVVRRGEGGSTLARLDRVRVFPDVERALDGRVVLKRVEARGLALNMELGDEGEGDIALIKRLLKPAQISAPAAAPVPAKRADGQAAQPPRFDPVRDLRQHPPMVRIEHVHMALEDRSGKLPPLAVSTDALDLRPAQHAGHLEVDVRGDLRVEGYGQGDISGRVTPDLHLARLRVMLDRRTDWTNLVAQALPDRLRDTRLRVRGAELSWPPAVTLLDVRMDNLDQRLPWSVGPSSLAAYHPTLEALDASQLTLGLRDGAPFIDTADATAWLGDGAQHWAVPLGDLSVHLDDGQRRLLVDMTLEGHGLGPLAQLRLRWDGATQRAELTSQLLGLDLAPYLRLLPAQLSPHLTARGGRVLGRVALSADLGDGKYDLDADVFGALSHLDAPLLHTRPVSELAGGARFHARFERDAGSFALDDATVHLGALRIDLDGYIEQVAPDAFRVQTNLRAPRQSAQAALASLPADFIPQLEGYVLAGDFDFALNLDIDTRAPKALTADGHIDVEDVQVATYGPHAHIPTLLDDFRVHARGLPDQRDVGPLTSDWINYRDIPPLVPRAVVSAEDGAFWKHHGFDTRGIRGALIANVKARRVVRGGSTITQQLVKNLYLNHDRTASRKIQEAFLTWAVEARIPKERILETYLNILHWGPNIYGLRAASHALFSKRPSRIAIREAAFLASILPNPNYWATLYARGVVPDDRRSKICNILRNMHRAGYIADNAYQQSIDLVRVGVVSISPPPGKRFFARLTDADPSTPDQDAPDL